MAEQEKLLQIVKSWNINQEPKWRGFKCANCQEYIKKAWHHWLTTGGYITPVHFCQKCEEMYKNNQIETKTSTKVDKNTFGKKYSKKTQEKFIEIIEKWETSTEPQLKEFTCNNCLNVLGDAKGYHVWLNKEKILIEIHLCRVCGDKLL